MVATEYEYDCPVWAAGLIFNGEIGDLTEIEVEWVTEFLLKERAISHWSDRPDEDPFFTHYPEFGPACNCFTLIGVVMS